MIQESGSLGAHYCRIPNPDNSALYHLGRHATVAAHSVITARPQSRFHFGAGMTLTGDLQHYIAQLNLFVFQRQQVQAGHDNVTSQQGRIEGVAAGEGGYYGEVFSLNERDVPVAALSAVVVPLNAFLLGNRDGFHYLHRFAPDRANTHPFHFTGLRKYIE